MADSLNDPLPLLYYGIIPLSLAAPAKHEAPATYEVFGLPWKHPRYEPDDPRYRLVPRSNVPRPLESGLPRDWTFTPEVLAIATSIPLRGQIEIAVLPSEYDAEGKHLSAPSEVPWHVLLQPFHLDERRAVAPIADLTIGDCYQHRIRAELRVDECDYAAPVDYTPVSEMIEEAFSHVENRLRGLPSSPSTVFRLGQLGRQRADARSYHGACAFVMLGGTGHQVIA